MCYSQAAPLETFLLGGVGEFGMNMMAVRTNATTVLIDSGIGFPNLQHYGINLCIPDRHAIASEFHSFSALLLTHGHEDHIGAIPFIWDLLDGPIYGTRLTLALVERRLNDHGIDSDHRLIPITTKSLLTIGDLEVEFISVIHSIPDSVAIVIRSPTGTVVHTGDFKFDRHPLAETDTAVSRFSEVGRDGVLAAYSDSTNASDPGFTGSELDLRPALDRLCKTATARIFITTFASSLHRIQLLVDLANEAGRKVAFLGRGIEQNVDIAERLGYINIPPRLRVPHTMVRDLAAQDILCVVSGSQGEPFAALSRMAANEHNSVAIGQEDTVVFSARTIPGNELAINKLKNQLAGLGARIFDNRQVLVHVSGHGSQGDLTELMTLLKPKYLVPIHGDFRNLENHAALAKKHGIIPLLANNGDRICFDNGKGWLGEPIPTRATYFDDALSITLKDHTIKERRAMATNGLIVVVCRINPDTGRIKEQPRLITRGVSTDNNNSAHFDDLPDAVRTLVNSALAGGNDEPGKLLEEVMPELRRLARGYFGNAPVVLPVILEH